MKKEFALLIILAIAVTIVIPSLMSAEEMSKKTKIGVVFKALDSPFWKIMEKGVYDEASKYLDIEVVVLAPQAEINVA
jgi:ABC-type sugar transport system substrate-binding protein